MKDVKDVMSHVTHPLLRSTEAYLHPFVYKLISMIIKCWTF